MKSIKKFFKAENNALGAIFVLACIFIIIVFIDAIMKNQHPTNEQIFTCVFMSVVFAIIAVLLVLVMIDNFKNWND